VRALQLVAVLSLLSGVGACDHPDAARDALAEIRARGEVRIVTLNLPTCYYLGAQGTEGLEYQLATAYAEHLGVKLNIYPLANEGELQAELAAGRADIAAASLSSSPDWTRVADAAEPYTLIPQLVVYQRDGVRPRDTLQLESATLAVRAGTPQERILERMRSTVAPTLRWQETAPTTADPVEDVDSGAVQYAITDEREFSFAHHLYPNVLVGFTLPEQRAVRWMVRKDAPQVLASVDAFFKQIAASGRLPQLVQESSGDTRRFEYEESREFQGNVSDRLPNFRPIFEEVATQSGIDWRLLAAIGYQESKWDPRAVSGDGAVGIMMLTADTAQAMGIKDRTNPEQSISAGARYLAEVRAKIPERIAEPDRTWLTIAAYNVGFGHLEDARILAQSRGKNPDSWTDVREQLPLLAQERWYDRSKRGYARGWEPVQFVDRIQRYLRLLEWQPGDPGAVALKTAGGGGDPAPSATDPPAPGTTAGATPPNPPARAK
jgi:membrane-bound lytic murein transglycosylase F